MDRYDAIVVGMGPGGEVAASRLLAAGKRVAVVERELIGGECGYWACIPSKTLLRPVEARAAAGRVPGLDAPALDWALALAYRDVMIRHLDDGRQVAGYQKQGAIVLKGAARFTGPRTVEVDGRSLQADHVIVATGSQAAVPPIEGLAEVGYWTNREATGLSEIPRRALLVGGSAVGVELGQFLARMGARVTIVQRGPSLMDREDPRVGELIRGVLEADGIDVRTGRTATRARRDGGEAVVTLDDGEQIHTDVIVLGAGRRPRLDGLGLEAAGIIPESGGLPVDSLAGEGIWAVGDVTPAPKFTHVAKYQARVVADAILGKPRRTSYLGIPRVVFSDPEVAAAGMTADQARAQGMDVITAEVSLPDALARPWTYETEPRGHLGLVADRRDGVLVGAWAVAPLAGEFIHQAAQAIRARIPLATLLDGVAQFPTYSEGYLAALERLEP
ncbi:MAG: pyridine nucleotide-disulfide oxidoreductase [Streptosporangiales bacterium]|nr:pyridine nucleotide-disulfide oxidoreductase [Streptosporangiales bacterium]